MLDGGFVFTERDFAWVKAEAAARIGLALDESKRGLVYNRLARRLRARNLTSFSAYRAVLESDASEAQAFINAMTTHVTSFFREAHHFDLLEETARTTRHPLRVWSSACSTGEEPYSAAVTLAAVNDDAHEILASDIDTEVIETGRAGIYPLEAISSVPARFRRFFERGAGRNVGLLRVRATVRRRVSFRPLNLLGPWPRALRDLDVIFCRNVLIYFARAQQEELVSRFVQALRPGGLLLLGHSESPGRSEDLTVVGRTAFRRTR